MADNERYCSTVQRKGRQVYIPEALLVVAGINEGDYMEVTIRKLKPASDEPEDDF